MDTAGYSRIMIIGNNGSGKSFLAKKLSGMTGLPLVHLDAEFWRPNWEMPSQDEWIRKNIELISQEKWIIDGNVNHGGTMALRIDAAELVIFLDMKRFVCLSGVLKRNGKKRSDTTAYLYEKFDKRFFLFCKEVWRFSKKRRQYFLGLHEKYPEKPFFIIKGRRKMNRWLSRHIT